jgi:uncharacterized protein YjbJ (UPF0337 family)
MNSVTLKGKWLQMRGAVKRQWGKLTDDELDECDGNLDILAGKVQERYGERRDAVEKKLDELMKTP